MSQEFKLHTLNDEGGAKVAELTGYFAELLARIEKVVPTGRERSLVTTKLQEAHQFMIKGITNQKAYRVEEVV